MPDDKLDRFLPLYKRTDDGMALRDVPLESDYRNSQKVPYGGGGLVSTVEDYLRFTNLLLNGGELYGVRLLSPKTIALMMMNHLGPQHGKPALNEAWLSRTENRTGNLNLGMGFGYGGYVITDVAMNDVPGSVGTYAWGGAASTYFSLTQKRS